MHLFEVKFRRSLNGEAHAVTELFRFAHLTHSLNNPGKHSRNSFLMSENLFSLRTSSLTTAGEARF